MRANLTAPALATWLVVGTIIYGVFSAPWYVCVLGGLAAGLVVCWLLVKFEPMWDRLRDWQWRGASAALFATIAITMPSLPSLVPLKWLYALLAAWSLYDCIRGYLRRNQPKA